MPDISGTDVPRRGRRRLIVGASLVVAAVLIGGATAWAVGTTGTTGYRMARVVRAAVTTSLDVVGTVEPVSNSAASFQVAGKVSTVSVTSGQHVTAGQQLATLDTTALTEAVSSAQSTLQSDQAKLTQDEESETATPASTATTTTTLPAVAQAGPSVSNANANASADAAAVSRDQAALVADQGQDSTDQQKESADLAQADSVCADAPAPATTDTTTSTTTSTMPPSGTPPSGHTAQNPSGGSSSSSGGSTPSGGSGGSDASSGSNGTQSGACAAALEQAYGDEQTVANDQAKVASDENTLAKALATEEQDSGSATTGTGTGTGAGSGTGTGLHSNAITTPSASNGGSESNSGNGSNGSTGSSGVATPAQIASDQADIDTAQADLIEAQQSLSEGQLDSPIAGTIASVGIAVGDTVAAGSSSEVIQIISSEAYEVTGSLTSGQVNSIKVGAPAVVSVDGSNGSIKGTVAQVGPVQGGSDGYAYPVVIALPDSVSGLFPGSTADVGIQTGQATGSLAVPTSAVQTVGSRAFVDTLSHGSLTRTPVKVGMVGDVYTQVLSGLTRGQSVVLADLALPVPSSNASTTFGGLGGFGGGAGRFIGGGGVVNIQSNVQGVSGKG